MGRARTALSLAAALVVAAAKPAAATVFDLRPTGRLGATDNAFGVSQSQAQPQWEGFATAGLAAQLQINEALSAHRFAYDITHTWFQDATLANNTAHALFWSSDFDLTGKTKLNVGASASLFSYAAIVGVNPAIANPTAAPLGTTPTTVLIYSGSETLTYTPNGSAKYLETFAVMRFDPLTSGTPLPATTGVTGIGRTDRHVGRDDWSLTLSANDYIIDSAVPTPTPTFANGSVVTVQLLAGWRRDINANTSVEVMGGPAAFYGVDARSLAIGPSLIASASYKHLPWYASLSVSQQPSVNVYLGQALLADAAIARVNLPLDKRETLQIVGIAGYTYARTISGSQHFVFAPRAYDLFLLDGSIAYYFEHLPFFASLDYSVTTQRGSLNDGVYIPSTLRRIVSLSVGGTFSWGEGNRGWKTAAGGH